MRDLQFDDMHLFARVAELGTLSAVARERDVPVSQISRSLSRIEKACGARLIHRSTHGLSLTPDGHTFREYCARMTVTIDELEGEFANKSREIGGLVRVAASTVIAQYQLVPSLHGLAQRHPRLQVELEVGDRLLDMARDGIDIAIRTVTNLPDTVVARQIGTLGRGLYEAPSYVKAVVLPAQPDDLVHPGQVISQFLRLMHYRGYVPPDKNNLFWIPYFILVGGDQAMLDDVTRQLATAKGRAITFYGKRMNLRELSPAHVEQMAREMLTLERAVAGTIRPAVSLYSETIAAFAGRTSAEPARLPQPT